MDKYDKVLGSLLGAATGDAMGAVTELRPTELIIEKFGGYVDRFITPPQDTFARGRQAGSVTDDFSLTYHTALAIADHGGVIDESVAVEALLRWSDDEAFFEKFAGPTTKAAVQRLRGVTLPNPYDFIVCDNTKGSNGAAMKISPAGLFNPGNREKAVIDAICLSMPTHPNQLSISGACAIAAAVSEAMKDTSDVYSIVQAGLDGATLGLENSRGTVSLLAGPSVVKRIHLAIELALKASSLEQAMTDIADLVGTGLPIYESVPAVFGFIVAAQGHSMRTIITAVNAGSDTDTMASMAGAIVGALNGYSSFPDDYLAQLEEVNGYDITGLARKISMIID
ncbi:hypothetical protein PNBC_18690 [Paenibacillus crassostreae]|uniref:ADP-ribosylglycohydrolase n=2 Tax=Paenibacillus crassostreae TaxID=1763538 RepID=A0A167BEX3_9BACL|nr:hypothetical protein PNBC_18690 [Paenibacillus crassostreae]